jgi:hypothetical protein
VINIAMDLKEANYDMNWHKIRFYWTFVLVVLNLELGGLGGRFSILKLTPKCRCLRKTLQDVLMA